MSVVSNAPGWLPLLHGLPHAGDSWWTWWHLDLQLLLPAGLVVWLYFRGLDQWEERSRPHSDWQTSSFVAGVTLALLSLESPLDALGDHHFTFHMVQHMVLIMIAMPLILLGAPTTPLLRGLPRRLRRDVLEPVFNAPALRAAFGLLTHPLIAFAIYVAVLVGWHFVPGWYSEAVRNQPLHDLQHFTFIASAGLVWWNVIDPRPLRARLGYLARMGYLLVLSTAMSFIGAFIAFNPNLLYVDAYGDAVQVVSLSLEDDQMLAGLIMWVPGQALFLAALGIVFFVWVAKSEQEQRAQDERALEASATVEA